MNTIIVKIEEDKALENDYKDAVKIIREGGLVAFPTETVYGLGADALNAEAAAKIYAAKGRPSDNPLIVHISDFSQIEQLVLEVPEKAMWLSDAFWPGPLTMIFKKSKIVPDGTTGGLNTVAIRMPANEISRCLIEASGCFLAAPSANISGRPSPTKAEHVIEDMSGRIDMIIDGGMAGIGLESTILDMTGEIPVILRPGSITKDMIEKVVGGVDLDPAVFGKTAENDGLKPKAPGMKYKHYAPHGDLTIVKGPIDLVVKKMNQLAEEKIREGYSVGIISTDETRDAYSVGRIKSIGTRQDEATIAKSLFSVLREFDEEQTDIIYSEDFGEDHLGQAIMNRLLKAAGHQVIYV